MPGRTWFIAVGDQQHGPYSDEQFRDLIAGGVIRPDTYVWTDGMADWQLARDIPGLLSSSRTPPPVPPRTAAAQTSSGAVYGHGEKGHGEKGHGEKGYGETAPGAAFSIDFNIWEMLVRALIYVIGFLVVVAAPWVAASFYKWVIERVRVPGRGALSFSGQPLDIWYVFVGLALSVYLGSSHIRYIALVVILLQAFLSWLIFRWIVANVTEDGHPLGLNFSGEVWPYIGWHVLLNLSFITIVGWAWVLPAQLRWMCRHIEGTRREISFNATGLEMLWRTLVFGVACVFIIPIPWMLRWYGGWYVSQFSATERSAV